MTEALIAFADVEAEEASLGAALLNEIALTEVTEILEPEDFYPERHQIIFRAMLDLMCQGKPADLVTVRARLDEAGKLARVGGASAISLLVDSVPDVGNAAHYAALVQKQATRRALALVGRELEHSASSADELLDKTLSELLALSGRTTRDLARPIGEAASRVVEEALDLASGNREAVALETGIRTIDERVVIRPGKVVVVAGGTSSGKTSLAMQIGLHQATIGKRVLVFSLEMAREELAARLLASKTGVPINRITAGGLLSQNQRAELVEASDDLKALPLIVDGSVDLTVSDLRARARHQQVRDGLDLVIVDYLQLLTAMAKGRSREQEVGEISRGVKLLARALNVPVLLLSQLSRRHLEEKRAPELRDLRESGAIENDADIVLLIHRPDIEKPHAELLIRKQRQGPLGKVRLRFDGPTTRFSSMNSLDEYGSA